MKKIKDNPQLQLLIALGVTIVFFIAGLYTIGPRNDYDSRLLYALLVFGNAVFVVPVVYFGIIFLFFDSPGEMAAALARKEWEAQYASIIQSINATSDMLDELKRNKYEIITRFSHVQDIFTDIQTIIELWESTHDDLLEKPNQELLDEFAIYAEVFVKAFNGAGKILLGKLRDKTTIDEFMVALKSDFLPSFIVLADKADATEAADVKFAIKYLKNLVRSRGRNQSL